VPRRIRDAVVQVLSRVPAVRKIMAETVEEVNVGYPRSPIAVGSRLKHARVAAGQHVPHVADEAVQKQLRAACGPHDRDHVLMTVTAGQVAPAAGSPGQVQVLVSTDDAPVAGYDAVVADPKSVVAQRFGLKKGGRVLIRPDGYIGAIAALDDTTTIADYFAKVRS
jgi:hypothetical protein